MSLRGKIFWFFSFSTALSVLMAGFFFFWLLGEQADSANENAVRSAARGAAGIISSDEKSAEDRLSGIETYLETINKEIMRIRLMRSNIFVGAGMAALGFLTAQFVLIALLNAILTRTVTRQWRSLFGGLAEVTAGDFSFRFRGFSGKDFVKATGDINNLLDIIDKKERQLAEQSKLLGWHETASFVSHQLKNPLAAISLAAKNLSLLLAPCDDAETDPATKVTGSFDAAASNRANLCENLSVITEESDRLSRLITRLREMTEFGELKTEPVDCAGLFREIAAFPRFAEAVVEVNEGNSAAVRPFLDKQYLAQAFCNLLQNTIDASRERDLSPKAVVDVYPEGDSVVVDYRDTITGLPPDLPERLGKGRYTTKRTGAGIGIGIVGRIAALHGGSLAVSLTDSGGLKFNLRFPAPSEA